MFRPDILPIQCYSAFPVTPVPVGVEMVFLSPGLVRYQASSV